MGAKPYVKLRIGRQPIPDQSTERKLEGDVQLYWNISGDRLETPTALGKVVNDLHEIVAIVHGAFGPQGRSPSRSANYGKSSAANKFFSALAEGVDIRRQIWPKVVKYTKVLDTYLAQRGSRTDGNITHDWGVPSVQQEGAPDRARLARGHQ